MPSPSAFELWKFVKVSPLCLEDMKEHLKRLCPDNPFLNEWFGASRQINLTELLHRAADYEMRPIVQEILEDFLKKEMVGMEVIERAARAELIDSLHHYTKR